MGDISVLGYVGLGMAGLLFLIVFFSTFFVVHTMQAGVVERMGKFNRIAGPGVNIKIPFIEHLVYTEDLNMQLMDVEVQSKTKDDATVHIPVRIQYYVLKDKVFEAYYKLDNPEDQIKAHVENAILSYIPSLDLDDVYLQEGQIAQRIKSTLAEVMSEFGYAIQNALVTQIVPSEEVVNAMNAINAARREKIATEARAEAEKVLKVKAAEADAEAKALAGKGIAAERKAIIEGLKDAVLSFEEGTGVRAEEVMALVMFTNYADMMRDIGKNSNTILMPHSPSAVTDLFGQLRTAIISGTLSAERALEHDEASSN